MDVLCPNCNATLPPIEPCGGRPLAMKWIYQGGGCDGSFNAQGDAFLCEDFNGGPPTQSGETSFIVVTDSTGDVVYHRDFVTIDSIYSMDSGNEPFPDDSIITVYKNNNTADLANLLQSVQYGSSCSDDVLSLKDRFGAHILVEWTNEEQGTASCFSTLPFTIDVEVPTDFTGGPATVTGLTIASNVDPFFFNVTESVTGLEVDAGDLFQTTIAIPIELTERRNYNMLFTFSASAGATNCSATALVTFATGYDLQT